MNERPFANTQHDGPGRMALSPAEAARLVGVGRTTLYEAMGSGALRSLKIGRRRLVTVEALKDWLTAAERAGEDGADHAR